MHPHPVHPPADAGGMTVATETNQVTYTGDGSTYFYPTTFKFLADAEIAVKYTPSGGVEELLVRDVDFFVDGAGLDAGGTIQVLPGGDPPAVASKVVIERTVPLTQPTAFRTQGTFSPAVHEDAFDESVFRDQQLDRRVKALESAGAPGSVIAGNGLILSGSTLHVVAGNGVQANADSVDVLFASGGAPAAVTAAAGANTSGGGWRAAFADHSHQASTAAPGAGGVKADNAASAAGSASTLARSDHVHQVLTAAPVSVTKAANATGTAATFARSDHKHDVTTAAAVDLTDSSSAEGSASTLARSDHTHSHGARGGGTLHAAASVSTAGFMSAADKTKLDRWYEGTAQNGTGWGVGAFAVTLVGGIIIADGQALLIEAHVVARQASGGAAVYSYGFAATVYRTGLTHAQLARTVLWEHGGTVAGDLNLFSPSTGFYSLQGNYLGVQLNWSATVFVRATL